MRKISTKRRQLKHVLKSYTRFNLELYKKGVIDKEEYLYNKKHIQLNNNVDAIKRLFSPILENKTMKQTLWEASRDGNWTSKKLWFKSNDFIFTMGESSRNNSQMVRDFINRNYNGNEYEFEQDLLRYRKENEKI